MESSIDVIIPTYDRPRCAEKLTASVAPFLGEQDRIVVVWQGKQKPDIRESRAILLLYSSVPSLTRARNSGIRAGSSDIVIFLDDDVTVMPGLLQGHRAAYADRTVGAVAGRIDDPVFDARETCPASFDETTGRLVQNFCVEKSQYTLSVMGANMSFRRKALEEIGLFDEQFRHNALWEEVDAAFRLRKAGWAIWYCSSARVRHFRETSGGCRTGSRHTYLYNQFANTAYFGARHCQKKYRMLWFSYWKYRLEFESRTKALWARHDPLLVLSGICGTMSGILRFAMRGRP